MIASIIKQFRNFICYYIKGEYHCDKCPFSWEERTSYEYDEWDGGCYIKGSNLDESCRLLPPFRFAIGTIMKKKSDYYFNHQYDGYGEFSEREQAESDKLKELLKEYVLRTPLYRKDCAGEYWEATDDSLFYDLWRVKSEYEEFAHPVIYKTLRQQWKDLINKTFSRFISRFKPYFCK